jgi:hypothetical protein
MLGGRPSEVIQAGVGTVIGAIFIAVGVARNGFDAALDSMEFQGAVVVVISYIAAGVTAWVARRQRGSDATLKSSKDGTVSST